MPTLLDSDMKTGACRWCGDKGPVFKSNSLCEHCDGDVVHCEICKCDQHRYDTCRHVFQDSHLEWRGSGIGWDQNDKLKAPFFRLLELMPAGFAADLRTAIRSGRFHTWFVAPLIGGGGSFWLEGMPDRDDKRWMPSWWGAAMIAVYERDDADEELDDARQWLGSLYNDQTPKASAETVRWIDEWITAQPTP